MDLLALSDFTWNAMIGGVIGSATYEGLRKIFGGNFNKLLSFSKENKHAEFLDSLKVILNDEPILHAKLISLMSSDQSNKSVRKILINGGVAAGGSVVIGDSNIIN